MLCPSTRLEPGAHTGFIPGVERARAVNRSTLEKDEVSETRRTHDERVDVLPRESEFIGAGQTGHVDHRPVHKNNRLPEIPPIDAQVGAASHRRTQVP
jgi:hypothetical protein